MSEAGPSTKRELDVRAVLASGSSAMNEGDLLAWLDLDAGTEDRVLARAVVLRASAQASARLGERDGAPVSERDDEPSRVVVQRASQFLGMPATPESSKLSVAQLDDIRTLLAVVRAGSLLQRRAAVVRMGELLTSDTAQIPSEQRKRAVEVLGHLQRRFDLSYEVARALAKLPGAEGRAARAEQRACGELETRVEARILEFWDGIEADEPIAALPAEERARLLSRGRDLSDVVVRHLAAVIDAGDMPADRPRARLLLTAIEQAGDARLLPTLRSALEGHDTELFATAVRALSRIEDPRVHGILKDAYERSARAEDRLLLAGALGSIGDARGLPYAREVLNAGDPSLLVHALEALCELGGPDDAVRVAELLEHEQEAVVRAGVAALGQIGDSRAIVPLSSLRERTQLSAARAEIEDAQSAIHARMELLGEEPVSPQMALATWDTTKMAARARTRDPALVRAKALLDHALGYLWLTLGSRVRAIARFEAAAALRPGWIDPVLAVAMLHVRRSETAQALAMFRRAIEIDRSYVEAHGWAITAMAQAFLRRAEYVEREGRIDIARGLVEELRAYDLRRAATGVRFALHERGEALRLEAR